MTLTPTELEAQTLETIRLARAGDGRPIQFRHVDCDEKDSWTEMIGEPDRFFVFNHYRFRPEPPKPIEMDVWVSVDRKVMQRHGYSEPCNREYWRKGRATIVLEGEK